jgi:pyridoxine/pyridoxamine 5'-phosphate oxidase
MHTPTVATLGLDGSPQCRTVVLRHFEPEEPFLRFHTDTRSSKYAELNRDPRLSMHFYDADEKIQLRLAGRAEIHCSDAVSDEAWLVSQALSRHCYATTPSPGAVIAAGDAFTIPTGHVLSDEGREHFCAVRLIVSRMEWLWLGSDGHRRAAFEWSSEGGMPIGKWLVP